MSDIQEEQKRLYKKAEENDYGDLLRKYNNLKTALDESQEVVISYKEENQRLKKDYDEEYDTHLKDKTYYFNLFEDYKSRNEKAIEYIGQHFIEEGSCEINKITGEYTCEGNENFLEELLNILQDKEQE